MWTEQNNCIEKEWLFDDFGQAFAFLTRVALLAEKQDHHPEIRNVYNRVKLILTTHDAGSTVTEKDRRMAAIIDSWGY